MHLLNIFAQQGNINNKEIDVSMLLLVSISNEKEL